MISHVIRHRKIISWNVNGIMPCIKNGSLQPLASIDADILCFQETRTDQQPVLFPGYHHLWLNSERSGYAGVLTLTKEEPIDVRYGLGDAALDKEGRLLAVEMPQFWSVNAYFPKSNGKLDRHAFRMKWDAALHDLLVELDAEKPVVLCGDFNITRAAIDIYPENARMMAAEAGYISEERDALEELLDYGFIDVFRYLFPQREGAYTWWSNRLNKRAENRGWRLDYFLVSERLRENIHYMWQYAALLGSDHCPIELMLKI